MDYDDELWQQAEEKVIDRAMHTSFCDRDTRSFEDRVMATYKDMLADRSDAEFEKAKAFRKYGEE